MLLSDYIELFVRRTGSALTYQIENYFLLRGFSSRRIMGAIGYLRSTGRLTILGPINVLGRNEHLFTV